MSALEQNFNPDLEDIKRREDLGNIFTYKKTLPHSQIVLSSHLFYSCRVPSFTVGEFKGFDQSD